MAQIFDSHAHYDNQAYDGDRKEVIEGLRSLNVCAVVNVASDLDNAKASIELADKYDFFWASVGVHPHEAQEAPQDTIQRLREMLKHPRVVALGEIGLDYYYDHSPRDVQRLLFERQLELAMELDVPVIIHNRDAHEDTLNILQKYKPRGVVHCFSGSVDIAREVLKLGMYIGLGGVVTFKNAKKPLQVAAIVPDDRLVLETDAPYLAPEPYRGKRCHSGHIEFIARRIAEIRGISVDALLKQTCENACKMYGIEQ